MKKQAIALTLFLTISVSKFNAWDTSTIKLTSLPYLIISWFNRDHAKIKMAQTIAYTAQSQARAECPVLISEMTVLDLKEFLPHYSRCFLKHYEDLIDQQKDKLPVKTKKMLHELKNDFAKSARINFFDPMNFEKNVELLSVNYLEDEYNKTSWFKTR